MSRADHELTAEAVAIADGAMAAYVLQRLAPHGTALIVTVPTAVS